MGMPFPMNPNYKDKSDPVLEQYIKEAKYKAELDELFSKVLQKEVYTGLDFKMTETSTKITLKVVDPAIISENNTLRITQFQNMIAQRLGIAANQVTLILEKIADKRLEPAFHAEELRQTFVATLPYKRVINNIIKQVKKANGQGVSIRVSGKIKGQRARSTKYIDGLLI